MDVKYFFLKYIKLKLGYTQVKTITGMDLIINVFLYIIFSNVLLQECASEQGKKLTSWF